LRRYVINADTSFTEQYQAVDGCDSLHTLSFGLLPAVQGQSTVELCEAGVFTTSLGEYSVAGDTMITETYVAVNGCDSVQTWVIDLPPPTTVLETAVMTDVFCAGGTDGTVRIPSGDFLFYFDGRPVAADSLVGGLAAGTYELSAETPQGCVVSRMVVVSAPAVISTTLPATVLITDPLGLSISAGPAGGTDSYSFLWRPGDSSFVFRLSKPFANGHPSHHT